MRIDESVRQDLPVLGVLDFQEGTNLRRAYLLRLAGLVLFAAVFILLTALLRPGIPLAVETFIGIAVPGLPVWGSILLVIADVVVVLYVHELVHAGVFLASSGAPPKIGTKGWLIFAAAPGYLNGRRAMITNALAPFGVISAVGVVLIAVLPATYLAWAFIPTVINAAAAGGDFMGAHWLRKLPAGTVLEDDGEKLTAYAPASR